MIRKRLRMSHNARLNAINIAKGEKGDKGEDGFDGKDAFQIISKEGGKIKDPKIWVGSTKCDIDGKFDIDIKSAEFKKVTSISICSTTPNQEVCTFASVSNFDEKMVKGICFYSIYSGYALNAKIYPSPCTTVFITVYGE